MIRKYPCVCLVAHAHAHNDGGNAIVDHLRIKYPLRDAPSFAIQFAKASLIPSTVLVEAPYPLNASGIAARYEIAPQDVTHVLVIVDANAFVSDPDGKRLHAILTMNGATGIGLGNVWNFDPESAEATTVDKLGPKTCGLISYIEQFLRRPVVFLATGPYAVIDREPFLMHHEDDPTRVIRYGE